jgi:hypothetical protein
VRSIIELMGHVSSSLRVKGLPVDVRLRFRWHPPLLPRQHAPRLTPSILLTSDSQQRTAFSHSSSLSFPAFTSPPIRPDLMRHETSADAPAVQHTIILTPRTPYSCNHGSSECFTTTSRPVRHAFTRIGRHGPRHRQIQALWNDCKGCVLLLHEA